MEHSSKNKVITLLFFLVPQKSPLPKKKSKTGTGDENVKRSFPPLLLF